MSKGQINSNSDLYPCVIENFNKINIEYLIKEAQEDLIISIIKQNPSEYQGIIMKRFIDDVKEYEASLL